MSTINAGLDASLTKDTLYQGTVHDMVESKQMFSKITTIIRSLTKVVESPFVSISAAKDHKLPCKTAVGTEDISVSEIVIDEKTDNAALFCEDNLTGEKFDVIKSLGGAILRSIKEKINRKWAIAMVAGATAESGTKDLSTKEKVMSFLNSVKAGYTKVIGTLPQVDNGTVIPAEANGMPFIVAGTTAYLLIQDGIGLAVSLSSAELLKGDNFFQAPNGVIVINGEDCFAANPASPTATELKQMVFGTAGAPVHAYRADRNGKYKATLKTGAITSVGTAGSISGDLIATDVTIDNTDYVAASVWNKPGVFDHMKVYLRKQVAA